MAGRRGGARPAPLLDRFNSKVRYGPGCWSWTGALNDSGYGVIWDGTRLVYAHRLAYELVRGPVPDGMQVDHLCLIRSCVNPGHLEVVTADQNNYRLHKRLGSRLRRLAYLDPEVA